MMKYKLEEFLNNYDPDLIAIEDMRTDEIPHEDKILQGNTPQVKEWMED